MTRQDAINTLTLWLIWWVFICHPEVTPDCVMCNETLAAIKVLISDYLPEVMHYCYYLCLEI